MDEPFLPPTVEEFISTPRFCKGKNQLNKSNSAPVLFAEETGTHEHEIKPWHGHISATSKVIRLSLLGLFLYTIIGVAVFLFIPGMFKGQKTMTLVDALYFVVATLCRVGYGDVVPITAFSKLFTSILILVGIGFVGILLTGLIMYVLENQEKTLHIIDKERDEMLVRVKVCLAFGMVFVCLAIGMIGLHLIEEMNWVDSFYLSVQSVTTVSYGDYGFKTVAGRCFAIMWLLISTMAVVGAFLQFIQMMISRKCGIIRSILDRDLTFEDRVAADMNRDGYISKAEYVVLKLKEMGKIKAGDVEQICKKFDNLEYVCNGKLKV